MTPAKAALIYIDGACWGNPGPAGAGVAFVDGQGRVTAALSEYIGKATNNIAEYTALLVALKAAKARGVRSVRIRTDSQLLARQINGQYRVRNETLRHLHEEASSLIKTFDRFAVEHVRRELNKAADKLATDAVEAHAKSVPALGKRAGI